MFDLRLLHKHKSIDVDGTKCYRVSVSDSLFDDVIEDMFALRLAQVKSMRNVDWANVSSFTIFHQGSQCPYFILCWWEKGNELFTSVSVKEMSSGKKDDWQEDSSQYSFCIYDLEIMAAERAFFIEALGDRKAYQSMWYYTDEIKCEPLLISQDTLPNCLEVNLEGNKTKLSLAEIERALNDINHDGFPAWSLVRSSLVVSYNFDSFSDAFNFVKSVANVAEEINHHPRIIHDFKRVRLEIMSHDVGCITERDIFFAERVGQVV